MSRFHFDESAANSLENELKGMVMRMAGISILLQNAELLLIGSDGFNIDYVTECINEEKKRLNLCGEEIQNGVNVLNSVRERVNFYTQFANSSQTVNVLNYVRNNTAPNGTYINPFYEYSSDRIAEKYFGGDNGWFVWSQTWDAFWDTIFNNGYERAIVYETLRSVIDGMNETNSIPDYIGKILDKYELNQYGSVASLTKELSGIEGFSNIMKYAGEARFDLNMIKLLASDYSINLQYLDSIENTLKETGMDNKVLNDVMTSLRFDYENKYIDALKQTVKKGTITLAEELFKTSKVGKAVLDVRDYVNNFSDGGKANDSRKNFIAITTYSNNMANACEKLGDKIASGSYTQQDIIDFENLFNVTKNLKIKQYTAALDFVDGDDIHYCSEAIDYYQNLSIEM